MYVWQQSISFFACSGFLAFGLLYLSNALEGSVADIVSGFGGEVRCRLLTASNKDLSIAVRGARSASQPYLISLFSRVSLPITRGRR